MPVEAFSAVFRVQDVEEEHNPTADIIQILTKTELITIVEALLINFLIQPHQQIPAHAFPVNLAPAFNLLQPHIEPLTPSHYSLSQILTRP